MPLAAPLIQFGPREGDKRNVLVSGLSSAVARRSF
jgi:hypothetical protein